MSYILKRKNRNTTFFSFITGTLLLVFSIMGFLKFKNYFVITVLIVGYYLANAIFDLKQKKSKLGAKSKIQIDRTNKKKKNSK